MRSTSPRLSQMRFFAAMRAIGSVRWRTFEVHERSSTLGFGLAVRFIGSPLDRTVKVDASRCTQRGPKFAALGIGRLCPTLRLREASALAVLRRWVATLVQTPPPGTLLRVG